MGRTSFPRLIILTILLAVTGLWVNLSSEAQPGPRSAPLEVALADITGWVASPTVPIDEGIVATLRLDDYVNRAYVRDSDRIFLYVGYYRSAAKVGAAHDPLVCFPGQGWKLTDRTEGAWPLETANRGGIRYSSMVAQRGLERQLLVYWFQSHDVASPDTFSQKLWLFWKKVRRQGTDNAFVRITVPVSNRTVAEGLTTAHGFIEPFYPAFLKHITAVDG